MKLLIRRDQRSGMLGGKIVFMLDVRASLTDDEKANIKKYKLADTQLYSSHERTGPGPLDLLKAGGIMGVAALGAIEMGTRLAFKAMTLQIAVKDLVDGKHIECKDVVELLAVENQIREAAMTFKNVLDAAAQFGGEEVMELA